MEKTQRLLVLWLTGRCNLSCRYCYAAGGSAKDMDMDTAVRAVKLMGDAPFKLQCAGGEPLLNMGLLAELLEYLKRCRPEVSCAVQTNGTLIDESFAGLVKAYGLSVGVSLDGKPDLNEQLRGKTKEAVQGIRLLAEHGIRVNLNTVVTAENVNELADMVDMAVYLGNVGGIGLDLLRNAGRAEKGMVHPASGDALCQGLARLKERLDFVNKLLPRPLVVREFQKAEYYLRAENPCMDYCFAAQGNSYVVLPDGDCYPCGSLAGQARYYMGNVHSTVRPLPIRCQRPARCAQCRYGKVCSGGCPSRGLLRGGFDELDCTMKKVTFQFAEQKNSGSPDMPRKDLRTRKRPEILPGQGGMGGL